MLNCASGLKDMRRAVGVTYFERVQVGLRVKLHPIVGSKLFKEDLVSVKRCLGPNC